MTYFEGKLQAAIDCMEGALRRAEHEVRSVSTPTEKIRVVLHEFAWGYANAMTDIECALAKIEMERQSNRPATGT